MVEFVPREIVDRAIHFQMSNFDTMCGVPFWKGKRAFWTHQGIFVFNHCDYCKQDKGIELGLYGNYICVCCGAVAYASE